MTTQEQIELLRKEKEKDSVSPARLADILSSMIFDFEALLIPLGDELYKLEEIKKELEIIRELIKDIQPLEWQ